MFRNSIWRKLYHRWIINSMLTKSCWLATINHDKYSDLAYPHSFQPWLSLLHPDFAAGGQLLTHPVLVPVPLTSRLCRPTGQGLQSAPLGLWSEDLNWITGSFPISHQFASCNGSSEWWVVLIVLFIELIIYISRMITEGIDRVWTIYLITFCQHLSIQHL